MQNKCGYCDKSCGTYELCYDCNQVRDLAIIKCKHCNKWYDYFETCYCRAKDKPMDEFLTKKCDDGHYVRSKAEMLIDNWLFKNNIAHAYETAVYLPKNPDRVLLCDFYLPQGDVYIEYWGLENDKQYAKRKAEKIALYDNNKFNRIDLNEKSIERLNDILPREIGKYTNK